MAGEEPWWVCENCQKCGGEYGGLVEELRGYFGSPTVRVHGGRATTSV